MRVFLLSFVIFFSFSIYLYSYNINPLQFYSIALKLPISKFLSSWPQPMGSEGGIFIPSILEIESLPNLIPYIQTLIKHTNTVGNPRLPSIPLSFPFRNPGLYIFFKIIHQSSQFLLLINCLYLNHPDLTFFFMNLTRIEKNSINNSPPLDFSQLFFFIIIMSS